MSVSLATSGAASETPQQTENHAEPKGHGRDTSHKTAGRPSRMRLDELLVERGLFSDAHEAAAAVLAGEVIVGEHRETHAGAKVPLDAPVRLKAGKSKDRHGFVSRGGRKLAAALDAFGFEAAGLTCADLGCSTGGFTDCLLQHGAAHVAAIDVGHADFDWRLRGDARVTLFERTNIVGIDPAFVGAPFDLVVADLSFISITRVMGEVVSMLGGDGYFLTLVKPQFEVVKSEVEKGGIVRDPALRRRVLFEVRDAAGEEGLRLVGAVPSPILGRKGNVEFLLLFELGDASIPFRESLPDSKLADIALQGAAGS